jgi:hypothetical protein
MVYSELINDFSRIRDYMREHHYLLFTLDSGVMVDLLSDIYKHKKVELL